MMLANCRKCQRVFQRTISAMCPECQRQAASNVSQVYQFVQDNPAMMLEDIATQCNMPYKDLEKLLLDGKLGTAAQNVLYRCQRCNQPTQSTNRRGCFCTHCADKVENEAGLNHPPPEKESLDKLSRSSLLGGKSGNSPKAPSVYGTLEGSNALKPSAEYTADFVSRSQVANHVTPNEGHGFKRLSEGG